MSSTLFNPLTPLEGNDNEAGFYSPLMEEAGSAGDEVDRVRSGEVLMRITPGEVHLTRGAPATFTLHIKALRDFSAADPLVIRLLPVKGRGTACFPAMDTALTLAKPHVRTDDQKIVMTLNASENAVKILVSTTYPADWWAGFSKLSAEIGDSVQSHVIEATVFVTDRAPAAWKPTNQSVSA